MIVLDTKVVSEALKPRPDPVVMSWFDEQSAEALFLTATSLSELLLGIELLPAGRRRQVLDIALAENIALLFGQRILDFDAVAARMYARLVGAASAVGRAISMGDGQIAAIAAVRGFAVASRDASPYRAAQINVINPWRVDQWA